MPEELPESVLRAHLSDLGIPFAIANRLEELNVFDVASLLEREPHVVITIIGRASYDDILRIVNSLRDQSHWEPPRHLPTRKAR